MVKAQRDSNLGRAESREWLLNDAGKGEELLRLCVQQWWPPVAHDNEDEEMMSKVQCCGKVWCLSLLIFWWCEVQLCTRHQWRDWVFLILLGSEDKPGEG
ncbi:P-loop containing nucleoside triphosphate hydrolase [Sesbania bispinosa]|nr:P-loop containing nucleoside triphosphate hydrolase [Sesbania bispinosa]